MTTAPQSAAPQSVVAVPPKKSRWSFSLLTLLLATGLVMAVISHVRTSRILENYRAKSDELEIESYSRIHVRRLHHSNHFVWRWRVFLPEGQFYNLHLATKGVAQSKLPPSEHSFRFNASGETIVDVFAADMISGTPYDHVYVVTIMKEGGGGSVIQRAAHLDVPGNNFLLAYEETAQDRTLSFAPDEPVVLLRGTNPSTPQSPADPSAEPGILIWIEPAAP